MPRRHALDDLEEMAHEHVGYELTRMALWTKQPSPHPNVQEAILEAYLIHVRNVDAFLTGRSAGARDTDVVGQDFFDREWTLDMGLLTPDQRIDIHRRIAHITTQRLRRCTPNEVYNWAGYGGLDTWAKRLMRGFGRFVGDLRLEHPDRAAWFRDKHDQAKLIMRT